MKITFLGATQEVTGSRYLIEHNSTKILVDCGLFQGASECSECNWDPFPLGPSSIDAIILTHAHIDHTGYIPKIVASGFNGKIYCSDGTYALCSIMLPDSGRIQDANAKRENEERNWEEPLVEPLYTEYDAEKSLHYFQVIDYNKTIKVGSLSFHLINSGHILGASFVIVSDGNKTLTFSGDLGRPNQMIMKAPPALNHTDYLVLESTYGDRLHAHEDPVKILGEWVNKTVAKGGFLIIPAFAVGRTQALVYCLYLLRQKKEIPYIPVYLDSPMGIKVTQLLCKFTDEHRLPPNICKDIVSLPNYTPTVQESIDINHSKPPAIIIAGSGMANGGRVQHHFKRYISDDKNTVLFVGFQAEGTLGRQIVDGEKEITIYGKKFRVNAEIAMINSLSAHADYKEILAWLSHFEHKPKKIFLTHGQLESAQALQKKIEERYGGSVVIPKYQDSFELS